MIRFLSVVGLLAALVLPGSAQQYQRRATFLNGGPANQGKCTIEVEVDGAADVEIRGDQGTIRNLSGQPASWRRFECTGPVPADAGAVRFEGVDGRGRMNLVQDSRRGGAAVIRIEDPDGGREGYTFDLFWGANGPRVNPGGGFPDRGGPGNADRDGRGQYNAAWAVRACEDAVRQRAAQQFGARRVEFLNTRIDDNPGRNDWVIGRIDVMNRPGAPEERLSFSCSVNFQNGRIRSVDLQRSFGRRGGGTAGSARAFQVCEAAAEDRLRRDGYNRIDFQSTRMDDNPGRRDWVIGNIRAARGRNSDEFTYSCSVDLNSGAVHSVDVRRR